MTMKEFLDSISIYTKYFDEEELTFYEELKSNLKQDVTEKGKKILKCMQDNKDAYLNTFSSKQIGEILFMPPRSVSGSMKKLINDGYVTKKSMNPVTYGLTDLGTEYKVDNQ